MNILFWVKRVLKTRSEIEAENTDGDTDSYIQMSDGVQHGVSIQVVRQDGNAQATSGASLFVRTHQATDSALRATVESLRQLDTVKHVRGVMRVEGEVGE